MGIQQMHGEVGPVDLDGNAGKSCARSHIEKNTGGGQQGPRQKGVQDQFPQYLLSGTEAREGMV